MRRAARSGVTGGANAVSEAVRCDAGLVSVRSNSADAPDRERSGRRSGRNFQQQQPTN